MTSEDGDLPSSPTVVNSLRPRVKRTKDEAQAASDRFLCPETGG